MTDRIDPAPSDTVTPAVPPRCVAPWADAPVGDDQYGGGSDHPASCRSVSPSCSARRRGCSSPRARSRTRLALKTVSRGLADGRDRQRRKATAGVWHETGAGAAKQRRAVHDCRPAAARSPPPTLPPPTRRRAMSIYPPTTLVEIENTHNPRRRRGVPARKTPRAVLRPAARKGRGSRAISTAPRPVQRRDRRRPARPRISRHRSISRANRACRRASACPVGTVARRPQGRHRGGAGALSPHASAARCANAASSPPAGIYALDNNVERLAEDHANTRLIAERLAQSSRVKLDMATVQTNILVFHVADRRARRGADSRRAPRQGEGRSAVRPFAPRMPAPGDASRREPRAIRDRGRRHREGDRRMTLEH